LPNRLQIISNTDYDPAKQDEVLVGKDHATVLSVNAPKEVPYSFHIMLIL